MGAVGANYIIISPAKDEERNIEKTILSVIQQTARPSRWVIVDDGSRDRTSEIVERYAQEFRWINLLTLAQSAVRAPGPGVVRAFNAGFKIIENDRFDFIVKLDCDLVLPPDYFERLLAKFQEDETLGIASGVYLEDRGQGWTAVKMPDYHAAGASKILRAECFTAIGGFLPVRGWDTIDETRAQMLGWRTTHFPELQVHHLRPEGSAIGFWKTSVQSGEGHYRMGGGKLFFVFKVIHRALRGKPVVMGAAAMAFGYLRALILRKELLVSASEAQHYRQQLNDRMTRRALRLFTSSSSS